MGNGPGPVTISANVEWDRGAAEFVDNRYSRVHRWRFDGGAVVSASSSPEIVPIPLSDPSAIDPEEAFVAALASCHMLWFLSIVAREGQVVETYRDQPRGVLAVGPDGRRWIESVTLSPEIDWAEASPDLEQVRMWHARAHAECFLANSVRTAIEIV